MEQGQRDPLCSAAASHQISSTGSCNRPRTLLSLAAPSVGSEQAGSSLISLLQELLRDRLHTPAAAEADVLLPRAGKQSHAERRIPRERLRWGSCYSTAAGHRPSRGSLAVRESGKQLAFYLDLLGVKAVSEASLGRGPGRAAGSCCDVPSTFSAQPQCDDAVPEELPGLGAKPGQHSAGQPRCEPSCTPEPPSRPETTTFPAALPYASSYLTPGHPGTCLQRCSPSLLRG